MTMAEVLQFQKPPPGSPPATGLRRGATGQRVCELEQRLQWALGNAFHASEPPNHFDDWTELSVQRFQRQSGLPQTGVGEAVTWQRLVAATGAGTDSRPDVRQGGAAAPWAKRQKPLAGAAARRNGPVPFQALSWPQKLLLLAGVVAVGYVLLKVAADVAGPVLGEYLGEQIREKSLNAPPGRCSRPGKPPVDKLEEAQILAS